MWTVETILGIIGGFLAIGGILLALISSGILGRRLSKRMACVAIGLALSGVGLFILLTSFPEYAIGFSVLAILALAIAAFLTIKAADAREERRRQEELLKEKRDQVRVWLAISQNWATSISERLDKDIAYYFATPQRLKTLTNIFMIPATDKTSILTIAEKTPDAELARILKEAVRSFDQLLVSLSNVKLSRDSLNKERKLVEERMEGCRTAMFHVIRRGKEIKTLLLLE